jgi:hypothetical protein
MAIKNTGSTAKNEEVKYEVLEKCGVISTRKGRNGDSTLELRYVAWNGNDPKYDIRPWYLDDDGNEKCAKGITLSGEELEKLGEIITILAEE